MSAENKVSTPDSTPAKPALNINLDYLVPTLSAICAGVIHHICNKKEALTYVDLLLIISPSLPVLLGLVVKIITFMINWLANGTQNMNLGFLGTMIQKMNSILQLNKQNVTFNNNDSLDKDGRIIFQKYTVNIDISKKMTEWQNMNYYIIQHKETTCESILFKIIQKFTNILYDRNLIFVNFYHEMTFENNKVIIYFVNIPNSDKYNLYIASSSEEYLLTTNIYRKLYPSTYVENISYYRISRIYNEYRDELLHTVKMYKAKSTNKRKVCMNFCFAGPPGTSKTYGARAIAKELTREIFEINLSKIVYEEDFLALFSEENIKKYVFLLDEIDLMCPSREFDDKLIKSAEETRLTTFGITKSNTDVVIDYDSEHSSLTEEDGFVNKKLLHQIHLLQDEVRKLHEKMDKTSSFQDWLKSFLEKFYRITSELLYINLIRHFIPIYDVFGATTLSSINEYNKIFVKHYDGGIKVSQKLLEEKIFGINSSSNDGSTSNNSPMSAIKTPFTLRTLLNFISGGNTHDDLVIIATTNRPEKLDPALIRPGRLRLIEFKNLRKEDAVCMLLENYPEEKEAIERGLDEIGYTDYMSNGALLEAVISSTHTLEKTLKTFQRELYNLNN